MNIKQAIKDHGFTMKQVGERMGITQQAVSQMATGKISLDRLKEIAAILGITVSELVADDVPKKEGDSPATFECPICHTHFTLTRVDDLPKTDEP